MKNCKLVHVVLPISVRRIRHHLFESIGQPNTPAVSATNVMTMDWLSYETEITSRTEFVRLLQVMADDARANPESWTTVDLTDFLDRMAHYAAGPLDGFVANMRPGVNPDTASWRCFADILAGARVYE